jgi:hypothetical protein
MATFDITMLQQLADQELKQDPAIIAAMPHLQFAQGRE